MWKVVSVFTTKHELKKTNKKNNNNQKTRQLIEDANQDQNTTHQCDWKQEGKTPPPKKTPHTVNVEEPKPN